MFGKGKNNIDEDDFRELIRGLKLGKAEAFHILYNRYKPAIYRFCLRILGDTSLAKDAYQDTFIKVFEHRAEFKGKNFTSWLYSIARHTCLNLLRDRQDFEPLDEVLHFSVSSNEIDTGLQDVIHKALAMLPLTLREAIVLREYEDCSYEEISEILCIQISTAKVRVFRAREILRKLLMPIKQELYES